MWQGLVAGSSRAQRRRACSAARVKTPIHRNVSKAHKLAKKEMRMDKISPCLWFDRQAEQAANYYVSLFPDSRINEVLRWPMDGNGPNAGAKKGDVLAVEFS